MSNIEILNHFYGASNVYRFVGSFLELQAFMEIHGVSFNSIEVRDTVYFACQVSINDERAIPVVAGE